MSIKAVFFDLDGTLLDSAPDFFAAMHRLMDEYQQARVAETAIRATVSDGARALTTLGFDLGLEEVGFTERHQRLLEIYYEEMGKNCVLFPRMNELLTQIKNAGLFWGIITNKPERFTDPILERLALTIQPNLVICPDHVNNTKPDPEPLILACHKVGCKPHEAIYIGDHQRDIDCAIAAGSPSIAVSFGYIKSSDRIENWNADHIADNADDIWNIINTIMKGSAS